MLSERETMLQIDFFFFFFFKVCWRLIFKVVLVLEMFLNGFCSLSSSLRAVLVNGSTADGQGKGEHGFWQRKGMRVVCVWIAYKKESNEEACLDHC